MFKLFHNINKQKKEMIKEGKIEESQTCNTDKNLSECKSINKIRQWQKELNVTKQGYLGIDTVEDYVTETIKNDFHINKAEYTYSSCINSLFNFIRIIRPGYCYGYLEKGCFQKLGIGMDKMYEKEIKIHNLQRKIKHEKEILGIK